MLWLAAYRLNCHLPWISCSKFFCSLSTYQEGCYNLLHLHHVLGKLRRDAIGFSLEILDEVV